MSINSFVSCQTSPSFSDWHSPSCTNDFPSSNHILSLAYQWTLPIHHPLIAKYCTSSVLQILELLFVQISKRIGFICINDVGFASPPPK
jgi:hypothetical protein